VRRIVRVIEPAHRRERFLARGRRADDAAPARALAPAGVVACSLVALAGLLLVLFPGIDHLWLDWMEEAAPSIELAFLTPGERQIYRESQRAMSGAAAEFGG